MPDQRSVMKEFRTLDEKRREKGLSPREESRYAELRDLMGPEMGAGGIRPGFDVGAAAARLRESLLPAGLRNRPPPVPEPSPEPEPDLAAPAEGEPDLGQELEAAWGDQPFAPIGSGQEGPEGVSDTFDPASLGLPEEAGAAGAEPGWDPNAQQAWDPNAAQGWDPNAQQAWDPNAAQGWDPNAQQAWDPNAAQGWDPNAALEPDATAQEAGEPAVADPNAEPGWDPNAAQGWDPDAALEPDAAQEAGVPHAVEPGAEPAWDPASGAGWDPNAPEGAPPAGWGEPETGTFGEVSGAGPDLGEPLDPSLEPEGQGDLAGGQPDLAPEGWEPAPPPTEAEPGLGLGEYDDLGASTAPDLDAAGLEAMLPFDAAAESAAVPQNLGAELDLEGETGIPAPSGIGDYDDTAGFFGSHGAPGEPEPADFEAGAAVPGLMPGDWLPEGAVEQGFALESSGSFEGAGVPAYQAPPEPAAEEELLDADVLEEIPTLEGAEILEEIAPEPGEAEAASGEPPAGPETGPPSAALAAEPPPPAPAPPPPAAVAPEPPPSPSKVPGQHRVVIHTVEGQVKRGLLEDPELDAVVLGLAPQPGADPEVLQSEKVKAIFFMLGPGEPPPTPAGKRVRVTFRDGRQIAGFSPDYSDQGAGFFMVPADTKTNTARIWVYRSAVKAVSVS